MACMVLGIPMKNVAYLEYGTTAETLGFHAATRNAEDCKVDPGHVEKVPQHVDQSTETYGAREVGGNRGRG